METGHAPQVLTVGAAALWLETVQRAYGPDVPLFFVLDEGAASGVRELVEVAGMRIENTYAGQPRVLVHGAQAKKGGGNARVE